MSILLHHGTFEDRLRSILDEGIAAPSYWGTEDEAWNYGDGPLFALPSDDFDESLLAPNDLMIEALREQGPDDASLLEWDVSPRTWRDSLRIFGSVRYDGTVMVEESALIRRTMDDPAP